jgi:hypothetical protein
MEKIDKQKEYYKKFMVKQKIYSPVSTNQVNTSAGLNDYVKPYTKSSKRIF